MLKFKMLTPYFFIIFSVLYFQLIISSGNEVMSSIFKHVDYLFTDLKIYSEQNYKETDYSVFSDQMICNQVSLIKIYPEFIGFQTEAEKRGIKCFKYNLNKLYFYSSLL